MTILDQIFFSGVFFSIIAEILRRVSKDNKKLTYLFDRIVFYSLIVTWGALAIKICIL